MNRSLRTQLKQRCTENGFSYIELIISIIIVGILSSSGFVNLSMRMDKERLKSTARAIESWINTQRNLAMQNNLTCKITIDKSLLTLTSEEAIPESEELTIDSENSNLTPPACDPNQTSNSKFDILQNFGQNKRNLVMTLEPSSAETSNTAEIHFSFRGFSQNTNLPASGAPFEIKLGDPNLKSVRCIKIISPIGLIRNGYALDNSLDCIYNNPF